MFFRYKYFVKFWASINSAISKKLQKVSTLKQFLNCRSFSLSNSEMSSQIVHYLDVPDKSEKDKKEYRVLKLANGATVLLVSDPSPVPHDGLTSSESDTESSSSESSQDEEESVESTSTEAETSEESDSDEEGDQKLAACALMVNVGSFSDPPTVNGLAHFLEHMIFMGSEKYPQENEFDSYIKRCGGFDNADTECEETSFYFEISEEHLDGAMERFSALFISPLMKKGAMTRERDAVESEFQSTMQDDEIRRDQLLAAFGQPGHPSSIFPWGNLETLKDNIEDDVLHKKLHKFRERHYSAHRMYICVQARLPIQNLEDLVVKHFSAIPSNNLPPEDFSNFTHENAFKEELYKYVLLVKPVSNICKLEITWCLPPLIDEYLCKPHHYIAYLLGYEGPGSLCAYLRRKLWALEMVVGIDDSGFEYNSMYSLFNLCIYLTEEGFNHINQVLEATYSYIKLFNTVGPSERLFKELQDIEATTFHFQTEHSAFDNVQDLVVNLKYYPPKHVLSGPELYFKYDEEPIWKMIRQLNTPNFNIMITSLNRFNGINYDKTEKWFKTEYTSVPKPPEWEKLWENAKPIPELYFPDENVFITKDFSIFWNQDDPTFPPIPRKIIDTDVCELWFRQDEKFLLPTAYMYFYFMSPLPVMNPKNAVLMTLYSLLIKYQLVEQLYPAGVAGLNYQFYSSEKGLVLKASGYNEKLHLIVDIIIKQMTTILDKLDERQLGVFIKQQQRNFYNSLIKPKSLNKDIRLCIIEHIRWSIHEKYNLLKSVKLEDLKEFAANLLKELKIQALIQGNLKEETAHNVMNSILTNFNCSKISNPKLAESRACQLPLGSNYIICQSFNENDVNTVVSNFYQLGPCTLRNECLLDLLMMFVEEPLFDILRTKEQLGYDISSSVRNTYGILGYTITVNSQEDKFTASHVEERIEAFRIQMIKILQDLSQEEYDHVRESLIKIKQVADNELKDEVSRNWGEITCDEYIFDRSKREVECLKTITKEDIVEFCTSNEKDNFRKLSIQVVGNKYAKTKPKSDSEFGEIQSNFQLRYVNGSGTIGNIAEFKKNLFVYPVTKTQLSDQIIEQCKDK